jgi:hypothetical protein
MAAVAALAACLLTGCGETEPPPHARTMEPVARPSGHAHDTGGAGAAARPHADHAPRHGGVLLMNGDVHLEIVLGADGRHEVWFSDDVRAPLAATVAAKRVTITVGGDRVDLSPSPDGDRWVGSGRALADYPAGAVARVEYAGVYEPYTIDLSVASVLAAKGAR